MSTAAAPELIDQAQSDDLASTSLSLARAFHGGATLWVIAPDWEPHAHHVAVEFVHPVIVGKRALPAVALVGSNLLDQVRVAARSGDVILAIAGAHNHTVQEVMRRAPAWGARTVWIGSGPRPVDGSADHVLWIDSDDPMVPATGRFVLLYHLLWELTHVCFEHPGLLSVDAAECTDEVCITCSDEGRLGEVIDPPESEMAPAWVRTATGNESVDVMLLEPPVQRGDLIVVHAGSALTRLLDDPREAIR